MTTNNKITRMEALDYAMNAIKELEQTEETVAVLSKLEDIKTNFERSKKPTGAELAKRELNQSAMKRIIEQAIPNKNYRLKELYEDTHLEDFFAYSSQRVVSVLHNFGGDKVFRTEINGVAFYGVREGEEGAPRPIEISGKIGV